MRSMCSRFPTEDNRSRAPQSRRVNMPWMNLSSGIARNRRLALNRGVVLRYRLQLEARKLAAATINVRLAAVRRLAYEAADTGC
jgi:hypothetical protein